MWNKRILTSKEVNKSHRYFVNRSKITWQSLLSLKDVLPFMFSTYDINHGLLHKSTACGECDQVDFQRFLKVKTGFSTIPPFSSEGFNSLWSQLTDSICHFGCNRFWANFF
jgi:hypothetical protein